MKQIFAADVFAAGLFAAGIWRGLGITPPVRLVKLKAKALLYPTLTEESVAAAKLASQGLAYSDLLDSGII